MCCLIPSDPIEDTRGKYRTWQTENRFQTSMMEAPCADGLNTFGWCCLQFLPPTMCCAQFFLRRKVLEYDMSKYVCCQGYFDGCCFKAGSLGEESCPDLCLALESCCCNSLALSASRNTVQDRYQLSSDPCDYRLIWISNCLQCLSCVCHILALIDSTFQECAQIIDCIANIVYHCVSGCMTAQVSHEMNYQVSRKNSGTTMASPVANDPAAYASQPGGQGQFASPYPGQYAPAQPAVAVAKPY